MGASSTAGLTQREPWWPGRGRWGAGGTESQRTERHGLVHKVVLGERSSSYHLLDVTESNPSGEVRLERSGLSNREDLRAVSQGAGVVAKDGKDAHDELEVALKLDLVICVT